MSRPNNKKDYQFLIHSLPKNHSSIKMQTPLMNIDRLGPNPNMFMMKVAQPSVTQRNDSNLTLNKEFVYKLRIKICFKTK
jgi:hypothetical protein